MMLRSLLERLDLLFRVLDADNGPKDMLGKSRRVWLFLQDQDTHLDVRRKTEKHEHLGHAGRGDAFPPGDFSLAGDRP